MYIANIYSVSCVGLPTLYHATWLKLHVTGFMIHVVEDAELNKCSCTAVFPDHQGVVVQSGCASCNNLTLKLKTQVQVYLIIYFF